MPMPSNVSESIRIQNAGRTITGCERESVTTFVANDFWFHASATNGEKPMPSDSDSEDFSQPSVSQQ